MWFDCFDAAVVTLPMLFLLVGDILRPPCHSASVTETETVDSGRFRISRDAK